MPADQQRKLETMARRITKYLCALGFVLSIPASVLHAAELVRDASLIETIAIQGVTLATPPKEAVERLLAAGYKAGPSKRYEDWKDPGIQFARGAPGAPEGESWVTLTRFKGRLIEITEMTNKPKQRFDATAEIGAVQSHFGIGADDRKCRANGKGAGHCRVQDATKPEDVNLVFGVQVLSITMNRYATRKKDMKESLK
jgi:hypothetical protein